MDLDIYSTIINSIIREPSSGDLAVNIIDADIREKVREHRSGATICFLVDASGSMGARKRMGAVKAVLLSILSNAYEKRDKVALVVFKGKGAKIIINPTRSSDLAYKQLREIKTGGKTPLAHGLMQAYSLLVAERIKHPDGVRVLVLVSDGKSNAGLFSDDPNADALAIADKIRYEGVKSIVIDTQFGIMDYGFARETANRLGGEYTRSNY